MIKYKIDEWFVKASVPNSYCRKEEDKLEEEHKYAKRLKEQIERHCDDYYSVSVDNNGHYECSFCGGEGDSEDDYACCEESVAEHEKKEKVEPEDKENDNE